MSVVVSLQLAGYAAGAVKPPHLLLFAHHATASSSVRLAVCSYRVVQGPETGQYRTLP